MERSHGSRVLQLAVCGAESPHTHNATNGLKPEFPALYKCWWWVTCSIAVGQSNSWLDSGIRKRLRSYTTAFYTPTVTLSKTDAPLLRVKKTPRVFKTNSRNQKLLTLYHVLLSTPPWEVCPPGYNRETPYRMYIHDQIVHIGFFLTEIRLRMILFLQGQEKAG